LTGEGGIKDPELAAIIENPFVKDTFSSVRKLVKARDNKVSTYEQLQMIKKELDAKFKGTTTNVPSDNETRAITQVQQQLTDWMTKNNADYANALSQYAQDSTKINQMKIGQKAQELLAAPIGDKERAASFAKTIADEVSLLKKTSGYTKSELADQLAPENMQKINNIVKELNINAKFEEQAMKGRTAISGQLGVEFQIPNMMNSAVTISNNLLGRLQRGAKEKTLKELAVIMQDPQATASLMKQSTKREQNALRLIQRLQLSGALSATSMEQQ
jgi:hypothetical protein